LVVLDNQQKIIKAKSIEDLKATILNEFNIENLQKLEYFDVQWSEWVDLPDDISSLPDKVKIRAKTSSSSVSSTSVNNKILTVTIGPMSEFALLNIKELVKKEFKVADNNFNMITITPK